MQGPWLTRYRSNSLAWQLRHWDIVWETCTCVGKCAVRWPSSNNRRATCLWSCSLTVLWESRFKARWLPVPWPWNYALPPPANLFAHQAVKYQEEKGWGKGSGGNEPRLFLKRKKVSARPEMHYKHSCMPWKSLREITQTDQRLFGLTSIFAEDSLHCHVLCFLGKNL